MPRVAERERRGNAKRAGGRSGPVAALAGAKSTRDKVRRADRFGELAVNGEPVEQFLGSWRRNAGSLNPQTRESLHRSGLFDEFPLSCAAANVIEQSEADGGKVGFLPRNHKDGQAQVAVQRMEVDDVETGHRDTLQQQRVDSDRESGCE